MTETSSSAELRRMPPMRLGGIEDAKKSKPFRLVDSVWRRLPLLLGVGVPSFLLILLGMAPAISPIYKVSGVILAKQEKITSLNGTISDTITGDVAYFQRTIAQRILDPKILVEALKKVSVENRPPFLPKKGDDNLAAAVLGDRLIAKEIQGTYLVSVELSGKSPKGLAPMLNAVMAALINELQLEQKQQYTQRLDYLHDEKTKITNLLAEERQRVISLATRYHDTSFLRPTYTADLTKLESLQGKYYDAQSEALAKEAIYQATLADQQKLATLSVIPFAEEKAIDNLGISEIESYNYQQSQALRATVDGLTQDNADRKNVETRIDAMKGFLADFKQNYKQATEKTLAEKQTLEFNAASIRAKNAAEAAKGVADVLREQYKTAKDEVSQTSEGVFEANTVNLNLAELRDRLNVVSGRLDDEELQAKAPLPVVVDQEALPPTMPSSSNLKKIVIMAFMASFGLLGGILFGFDFLDQRIRSREELGAAVGGLGAEPIPATVRYGDDPEFCKKLLLNSLPKVSSAIRDLALRLILEHERGGAKIISFVGVHRRSGNTSIALNVARAISAHGFDVLLAEMPTSHPGLASAAELTDGQTSTSPWGNKAQDPSRAVEIIPWVKGISRDQVRMTLDSFLANATKVYDFVLLDLVALPGSDISHETSVKSDIVVLTAAKDMALYGAVSTTVAWIVAGGVPAVTTVLNFDQEDAFRRRVYQLLTLLSRKFSYFHNRFRDWFKSKEARLFAKLSTSPKRKKIVDLLQSKPPVAPPPTQGDQDP